MIDPTVPYPPAAVLGLMRVVMTILQSEKYGDTVTAVSSIGIKSKRSLKPLSLMWDDAMRVLRRSHKLLRQVDSHVLTSDIKHCGSHWVTVAWPGWWTCSSPSTSAVSS